MFLVPGSGHEDVACNSVRTRLKSEESDENCGFVQIKKSRKQRFLVLNHKLENSITSVFLSFSHFLS